MPLGRKRMPGDFAVGMETIRDAISTRKKIIEIIKDKSINESDSEDKIDDLLVQLVKNNQLR